VLRRAAGARVLRDPLWWIAPAVWLQPSTDEARSILPRPRRLSGVRADIRRFQGRSDFRLTSSLRAQRSNRVSCCNQRGPGPVRAAKRCHARHQPPRVAASRRSPRRRAGSAARFRTSPAYRPGCTRRSASSTGSRSRCSRRVGRAGSAGLRCAGRAARPSGWKDGPSPASSVRGPEGGWRRPRRSPAG